MRCAISPCVLIGCLLAMICLPAAWLTGAEFDPDRFLKQYCAACHQGEKPQGHFSIAPLIGDREFTPNSTQWLDLLDQLGDRAMPPADTDKPRPSMEEYSQAVAWLKEQLAAASGSAGRMTRRLNRPQYNNTIRDLLHISHRPADSFPQDLGLEGFNNVVEVQTLSPFLLQKYLTAAEESLALAITTQPEPEQIDIRYYPLPPEVHSGAKPLKPSPIPLKDLLGKQWPAYVSRSIQLLGGNYPVNQAGMREGQGPHGYEMVISQDGKSGQRGQLMFNTPLIGGRYRLTVQAYATPRLEKDGRPIPPQGVSILGVSVNGEDVQRIAIPLADKPQPFVCEFTSDHSRTQVYLNGATEVNKLELKPVPNLVITEARLEGPLYDAWPPASHRAIFGAGGTDATPEILRRFASRAFRRPATDAEVAKYTALCEAEIRQGASPLEAIRVGLKAILVSPHFLFLIEPVDSSGRLSDYALASRLSYFLWSSMPDDELFQLAADDRLHLPAELEKQVARMLQDPKAEAFVNEFGGQWIGFHRLAEAAPDPDIFPTWDEDLRRAMLAESQQFFRHVMLENRRLTEFLLADYTFANERLARHYGIEGVQGGALQQVALPADSKRRGGLITQAGVLTVASQPTRSSPVFRGIFVLEKLFNRPPPNPPADVPALEEAAATGEAQTVREQLARHRADASCAACHNRIDPWGLPLEEFDGIGRWRKMTAEDLTASLQDGEQITGAHDLQDALLSQKDAFVAGLAEKMLLYALGRTLSWSDQQAEPEIVRQVAAADYRFQSLVQAIILSPPFQNR
ncbi:DUF1592 domain-containing protein [Lignipirellula cremea]|uniref:Planctomycete cytochrome C n=1 Tax=Lignipirellula cremea TaxID=2528010 RepID=A0A518DYF2_9BACT|nr:DUF1592 domain-containing protein [Lignipirellula cremea]QDU96825.1 hypothetical protein Pla8534_46470 [Lignipirellula cremea]